MYKGAQILMAEKSKSENTDRPAVSTLSAFQLVVFLHVTSAMADTSTCRDQQSDLEMCVKSCLSLGVVVCS